MTVRRALDALAEAAPAVPVVMFSYLNPVLAYGPERFVADAAEAGAAGLLLTDLPAGDDPPLERALGGGSLALVSLVAPTTTAARLARMVFDPRGFVYLIARRGVTGMHTEVGGELTAAVARVRQATSLPIAVGFGIREPAQARAVAAHADGVVVGSALVECLADGLEPARALVRALRHALDAVPAGRGSA
jgi:tryptophan synthase alpha chain